MAGAALPLPARVIGTTFITNKGAFLELLPRFTSFVNAVAGWR
ncbi:hypothetical protein SEEM030_10665 [Salmonella enterica subsp. enterica serovar Montevideo str. SARB30]|nr:hypothetical protein SEEM030_10665 [Salmonella enterica subsp. enterica serovar Montevideo str. SARB30]